MKIDDNLMKIDDNMMKIDDNLMKLNDNSMKLDQPGLPLWQSACCRCPAGPGFNKTEHWATKLDIGRQKGIFCKRKNGKMEVKNMKMYKQPKWVPGLRRTQAWFPPGRT